MASNPLSNMTVNATGDSDPGCSYLTYVDADVSKAFKTTAYVMAMCVSLVGNILVVAVVLKNRSMRTVTNYLIVNMAVSDLFLTLFNMPQGIYFINSSPDFTWPVGDWGTFSCKFLPFIQSVSVASSVLTLTAIAIDRFLAIVFPLKVYVTFSIAWVTIATVWVVSTATSAFFLSTMIIIEYGGAFFCYEVWAAPFDSDESPKSYTIVLFVAFYVIPLVTMSILYGILIWKLWIRKVPGQHSLENQKRADKSKKKVLKMLMTVVALFAVCWLPVYIMQFLSFFAPKVCIPHYVVFIGYFFGHLNSAINPCVYAIFNVNFRRGFIDILKTLQCRPHFKIQPLSANEGADNACNGGSREMPKGTALTQLPP